MEANNMAAMREALVQTHQWLVRLFECGDKDDSAIDHIMSHLQHCRNVCATALAKPPRNCDVISNRDDAVRIFQAAFVEAVASHLHLTNAAYVKLIEPLGELFEIAIEALYSTYHAEDSAAQNKESEVAHGNA